MCFDRKATIIIGFVIRRTVPIYRAAVAYFIIVAFRITRLSFVVIIFVLGVEYPIALYRFACIIFSHAVTAQVLALPCLVDDFFRVVCWAILGKILTVHLDRNDAHERLGIPLVDDLCENRFTCALEGEVSVDSMQANTYDCNSPQVAEAKSETAAYQCAFIVRHLLFNKLIIKLKS